MEQPPDHLLPPPHPQPPPVKREPCSPDLLQRVSDLEAQVRALFTTVEFLSKRLPVEDRTRPARKCPKCKGARYHNFWTHTPCDECEGYGWVWDDAPKQEEVGHCLDCGPGGPMSCTTRRDKWGWYHLWECLECHNYWTMRFAGGA